jgi:transposase
LDLTVYYNLVSSETSARRYLTKKCLAKGRRVCLRCGERKLYKLSDERRRCARCDYTFHDFSGRWINQTRLSCVQWLSVIKLFELDVPATQITKQLRMNHKTVLRAVGIIRSAIAAGETFRDSAVFSVQKENGRTALLPVSELTASTLLTLPVKKFRKGNILYTSQVNGFEGLVSHLSRKESGRNGNGSIPDNGSFSELPGFLSWAGEKFHKQRRISRERFPFFLKELEFRYNHKDENMFDAVTELLCALVPEVT